MSRQTRKNGRIFCRDGSWPGQLVFPLLWGRWGRRFDIGGGGVEQLLARGGPLCLSPSLRLHLFPPFASVGLFSPCLCPPSCSSFSPLSPAPLCLSTSGAHRSLWALSAHPASVRPLLLSTAVARRFLHVLRLSFSPASSPPTFPSASVRLSFPYLSLSASPFHLCRPPFSMCSGSLPFRRFLSACLFLRLSPSGFFSPRFRPPFFPSGLCPPAFLSPVTRRSLYFAHPPFSTGFPCLPVWPSRPCYPSFSPPFPFAPVCPIFLSTPAPAYFSPPSLHPSFSPPFVRLSFPPPLPPALLSVPLPSVRPPGRKEGRPLDI